MAVADALQRFEKYVSDPNLLVRSQQQWAIGQGRKVHRW